MLQKTTENKNICLKNADTINDLSSLLFRF